ncbi:hypothetical protein HC931_08560 [Candidatus Gracilibacteria bacterium]|jgi:hypothetical protein|nr:hypothetical protein [Candidatus Gracilibacteria bacterium]NJM85849.1 hypothetical protein [Hydrococcus sp. RU_2_2]NJP21640.1 hypothetical protein [Hydrococcus sp. CRU_1_1]
MQLSKLVCQALQSGCISTELKAEIGRICAHDFDLSAEDEFYLDRIMGAMLTGEVVGLY